MAFSDYVARRMLCDICNIVTPIESRFEHGYDDLCKWMESYTTQFDGAIFNRLPRCKTIRDELLNDMSQLYTGIFSRVNDIHGITTLHCLFTLSFYMMVKYKEQPIMCGEISYYFRLITQRLESWEILNQQ